jgi:hypothetical protein
MPWSKGGIDGTSHSIAVKSCIDEFHLRSKVIGYTSDGGDNLKTRKDYLNAMVSNDAIFNPSKSILEQSCWAHALSGAYKKAVIDAQTGTLSIEQTQINCRSASHGQKKSKRVQFFERSARVLPSPPSKPLKTRFACLTYAFCCLVSYQAAINILYGQKEGMSSELCKRLPSNDDWEAAR